MSEYYTTEEAAVLQVPFKSNKLRNKKTRGDGRRNFSFGLLFSTCLGLSVYYTASTSGSIHDFNRYFTTVEFRHGDP